MKISRAAVLKKSRLFPRQEKQSPALPERYKAKTEAKPARDHNRSAARCIEQTLNDSKWPADSGNHQKKAPWCRDLADQPLETKLP